MKTSFKSMRAFLLSNIIEVNCKKGLLFSKGNLYHSYGFVQF